MTDKAPKMDPGTARVMAALEQLRRQALAKGDLPLAMHAELEKIRIGLGIDLAKVH